MDIQPATLTVSQLNRRARQLLETHLPLIWVEGEISNFSRPGSGHWYLTLKDEQAQVRCAMFRNRNSLVRFSPGNGNHVLIRCRVSLYEGRGDFQLIIEHMEEAGHGALQRQFDALKLRLSQEGLFAEEHKRLLPSLPKRIGIITSPTGAAVRDILSVLKRRFPAIPVTIYPSIVQGSSAASQLANAINFANEDNRCDVLIVGRGGGSLEDLWAFNEEVLVRAIHASEIPIISAVGHETDFTIADFAADYRAPTPSAAAEILSPNGEEIKASFQGYEQLLIATIQRRIQTFSQQVDHLQRHLRHPGERLQHQSQQLSNLKNKLQYLITSHINSYKNRLYELQTRQAQYHPNQKLNQFELKLESLEKRLHQGMAKSLEKKRACWENSAQLLHTVSPLNTLQRGYAIVMDKKQQIVRSVLDVTAGDKISTQLIDGSIHCSVDNISTVNQIIPEE